MPLPTTSLPTFYGQHHTDDSTWLSNINYIYDIPANNYTFTEDLTSPKWYYWKIKAKDESLSMYSTQTWRFLLDQPPSVPVLINPANGEETTESDYLEWAFSTDPDEPQGDFVKYYHLQIDDDPDFLSPVIDTTGIEPQPDSTSVTITVWNLPDYLSLENKNYYWRVSAIDSCGIESDFSDGSDFFLYILSFNLKILLEGPFNGSVMNNYLNAQGLIPLEQPYNSYPWFYSGLEQVSSIPNSEVVDWVLIEIRETLGGPSTATPDKIIYQRASFILTDGSIVELNGADPIEIKVSLDNNTFLVIHHRNHLSIMSADPLEPWNGTYDINLTNDPAKVYGVESGYKEIGINLWGMVSGDFNADGIIDTSDIPVWHADAAFRAYLPADANLGGDVDNKDKNDFWFVNKGTETQVPH